MVKFKFEKYDYAKIGIKKKVYFQQTFSTFHFQTLGNIFRLNGTELAEELVNFLKSTWVREENRRNNTRYDVNDFDFEWKIITPEITYTTNDTSS